MSVLFDNEPGSCIRIGLVNNMSDEALKGTERQFISLLESASDSMPVHLSFYTLPGIPRNGITAAHISSRYSNIEELWDRNLDGLIVTGREPKAANLADEPYWHSFTKLLAWAQENCHATVFSCLAAHAAILHMDGIRRVKRDEKIFGIFECARVSDHPLIARTATHFRLPHSRWNGIPEEEIKDCGYKVLTRSAEAGVDTFVKQQKKLFVFFQGHPEYESDTLLREYQRDIGRYIKGDVPRYPLMPGNYFDEATVEKLAMFQERALARRGEELLPELTALLANKRIENTWQSSAAGIYRSWLAHICAQKETVLVSKRLKAMTNREEFPGYAVSAKASVGTRAPRTGGAVTPTLKRISLKPGDAAARHPWSTGNRPGKPHRSVNGE
jgi:homoserine O-succinyltransferase/O-acetyltransferase